MITPVCFAFAFSASMGHCCITQIYGYLFPLLNVHLYCLCSLALQEFSTDYTVKNSKVLIFSSILFFSPQAIAVKENW